MNAPVSTTAGFTYFEVMLASVLLAGAVTCMGLALEQSATVSSNAPVVATADYLLQDGVAWARSLPRLDASGSTTIGMESGESAIGDIDDVDDLNGLKESPPIDRTGFSYAGWTRSFLVETAQLANPALTTTSGSTPLLRVTITVARDGVELASDTILLARTP